MEIEILNEIPLSFVDIKKKLSFIKNRDNELNLRSTKTKKYIDTFSKLDEKKTTEIIKKLNELDISRLKEKHVIKIINILPKDVDSLKTIFDGEDITLKQEDLKRILDVIKT